MSSLASLPPPTAVRDVRLWRAVASLAEVSAEQGDANASGLAAVTARMNAAGGAEQLVLEFDEAYTAFVDGFVELPSEGQMLALQAVDRQVASMVALKDASVWSESAQLNHASWHELRALAARVLSEFDWPDRVERETRVRRDG